MNIRIFDNGFDGQLADIVTAIAGVWGTSEEDSGEDVYLGSIIVGFRYNVNGSLSGYPYNLPDGTEAWHTTMAIISYTDNTSEIKSFTSSLAITKTAKMIILITRNLT